MHLLEGNAGTSLPWDIKEVSKRLLILCFSNKRGLQLDRS